LIRWSFLPFLAARRQPRPRVAAAPWRSSSYPILLPAGAAIATKYSGTVAGLTEANPDTPKLNKA
jgi:hypothetical protein